jgi:serine/threonine protein kinase
VSAFDDGGFGRFDQLREVGDGGQARVCRARDRLLDRSVALKLLRTSEPDLVQRLLDEARLTARCRHDNVVVIYEVGHQNGCPFLVLEYLAGRPVSALLDDVWRLPYARAIEIVTPVLQALQHVHDVGVVHRDLKPDNIFLTDSNVVKLLDFGIAKEVRPGSPQLPRAMMASRARLTRAGMIVGSYEYMSPEQWPIGIEVDHLTDIWACGILLHRMICGGHPLHPLAGPRLFVTGILDQPMPSMSEAAPADVPRELISVVDRCLVKSKEQRWQSATDLLAALAPFARARPVQGSATSQSDATTVIVDTGSCTDPELGAPAQQRDPAPEQSPVVQLTAMQSPMVQPTAEQRPAVQPTAIEPAAVPPPIERTAILFLAADPTGTNEFTLDRQARDIQAELERSGWRDSFELVTQWAPEAMDLLRALRKKPTVVHFAGSGEQALDHRPGQALVGDRVSGLFLKGRDGRPQLVAPTALDRTFGAAGKSVKVVLMSACYSEPQAEALLLHVDCVVGLRGSHPEAAKAYAIGFYGALGERESAATAHEQGRAAMALWGYEGELAHLKVRPGVDARKLVLAAAVPSVRDRR